MFDSLKRATALLLLVPVLSVCAVEDSTDPVGIYKFQVQQGSNLFVPGLVTRKEFQGALTGAAPVSPNSALIVADAGWTPGAFNETASQPTHYAEIVESGHPSEGLIFDIVSNTATTLNVAIEAADFDALNLAGTESICVRAHTTLASVFKNATITSFSDFVIVYNDDGTYTTYIYNGTDWLDLATFLPASNRCVYPGQGLVFVSDADKDLVIGGDVLSHVKLDPTRVSVYKNALNLVGQVNPLTTLGGPLGALALPDSLSAFSDYVQLYTTEGNDLMLSGTYISNGSQMLNLATFLPSDNDFLEFGVGISVIPSNDLSILIPPGF